MAFWKRKPSKEEAEKRNITYGEGVQKQFNQHEYNRRMGEIRDLVSSLERTEASIVVDEKDIIAFFDRGWTIQKRVYEDGKPSGKVEMVKKEDSEAIQILKTQVQATQGIAEIGDRIRPSKKALLAWQHMVANFFSDQATLGKNHPLVNEERTRIVQGLARLFNVSIRSYHTDINVFEAPQQNPYSGLQEMFNKSGTIEK